MLLNIVLSFLSAIGAVVAVFLLCVTWNTLLDKLTSYFVTKGLPKEYATDSIAMALLVVILTAMFYMLLFK